MNNPRTPIESVDAPMEIGDAAASREAPPVSAELAAPIELCVVVPTLNERGNVDELLTRLMRVLRGINWEIVFVDDDSDDGTADKLRKVALRDRRIRCLQRLGRRGLASACVEGMLATPAPFLAVMDADLQHDETCLPRMLEILRKDRADLVIGSRYVSGGSTGNWDVKRAWMSRCATALARLVFKQEVADPMSGFFMMRRSVLDSTVRGLSTIGFKILLDTIASSPRRLRIAEVPFTFRERFAGDSKFDSAALWEFGMLVADKLVGRYVPVRFLSFIMVGSAGVLVHVAILSLAMRATQGQFPAAQSIGTIGTMIFNFWLNNLLTYRDRRLHGWSWVRGLATFMLACSIGALANVGVASYLFENQTQWLAAALAGVLVGAVWNYAITQLYTWGRVPRR